MKCYENELQKLLEFAFGDFKAILLEVFRRLLIGNIPSCGYCNSNAEHWLYCNGNYQPKQNIDDDNYAKSGSTVFIKCKLFFVFLSIIPTVSACGKLRERLSSQVKKGQHELLLCKRTQTMVSSLKLEGVTYPSTTFHTLVLTLQCKAPGKVFDFFTMQIQ